MLIVTFYQYDSSLIQLLHLLGWYALLFIATMMVSVNIFHNISNLWSQTHFLLEQRYIQKPVLFQQFYSDRILYALHPMHWDSSLLYFSAILIYIIFASLLLINFSSLDVLFQDNNCCLFLQVRVVKVGWFKLIECKFIILRSYWQAEYLRKIGQEKLVLQLLFQFQSLGCLS